MQRLARGLRRRILGLLDRLMLPWRRRRQLARGVRKVEVGSGGTPQPGYLHIDHDARAPHLEWVAEADELPLPDAWADELLACHILEHVAPRRMQATLREWRRVLRPGGTVEIHVPDSARIMARWLDAPRGDKWALQVALLGMSGNAGSRTPEQITMRADHQILFDTVAWQSVVPKLSMVFTARRST